MTVCTCVFVCVANDKLLHIMPEGTPLTDAFLACDNILRQGVEGISDLITRTGLVNIDFSDIKKVMCGAGTAMMGIGHGKGSTRAVDAAHSAMTSPLLVRIQSYLHV